MLGKKIKIAVDNRPFFYYNILRQWISDICASGSGVEHHLAKVGAAGSNPVSRSFYLSILNFCKKIRKQRNPGHPETPLFFCHKLPRILQHEILRRRRAPPPSISFRTGVRRCLHSAQARSVSPHFIHHRPPSQLPAFSSTAAHSAPSS